MKSEELMQNQRQLLITNLLKGLALIVLLGFYLSISSEEVISDHHHPGSCNTCTDPSGTPSSMDCTFIDYDFPLDGGWIDDQTLAYGWHHIDTASGYEFWYKLRNSQPGVDLFDFGTVAVSQPGPAQWPTFPNYQLNGLFSETKYVATVRARPGPCPVGEYWWTRDTGLWGFGDYGGWLELKTPDNKCGGFGPSPKQHYFDFVGVGGTPRNTCRIWIETLADRSGKYGNFYQHKNTPTEEIWQVEYDDLGKASDCDLDYGWRYTLTDNNDGVSSLGDRLDINLMIYRRDAGSTSNIGGAMLVSPPSVNCTVRKWIGASWQHIDSGDVGTYISPANPGDSLLLQYTIDWCGDSKVTHYDGTNTNVWEECDPPFSACTVPGLGAGTCRTDCRCELICPDNDNDGYGEIIGGVPTPDCNDCDDNPANDASGGGKWTNPGYTDLDNTCNGVDNDCDGSVDEEYPSDTCGSGGCTGNKYCSTMGTSCVSPPPGCPGCPNLGCMPLGATVTCNTPPLPGTVIYNNLDCGTCCKCTGGTALNPAEAYDETQDADCTTAACPAGSCGLGGCGTPGPCGGGHIYGYYTASSTWCTGLKTCQPTSCTTLTCVSDVDTGGGDGYTSACGDCDITNKDINPCAPDAICNGVDNDCDGLVDEDYPLPGPACGGCPTPGYTGTMVCVNGVEECANKVNCVCTVSPPKC